MNAIISGIKASPGKLLDAIKSLLPGGKAAKIGHKAIPGLGAPAAPWSPPASAGLVGEAVAPSSPDPGRHPHHPADRAPARGARASAPPSSAACAPPTTAHFFLDRRLVATAVAEDTADQKARRGR